MVKNITTNRLYQLPPDVDIVSHVENPNENRIDIHISLPTTERTCPHCGSHSCVIKDSGREQTFRHLPAVKRSTFVTFRRKRFLCQKCVSTFSLPVDFVHDRLRITKGLYVDICMKLTELKSIKAIAEEEMVTRDIVTGVLKTISFDRPKKLPVILCIDEFKGDSGTYDSEKKRWKTNRLLTAITDGANRALIDVLPYIDGKQIVAYFMQYTLEERNRVKFFSCDMSNGFISVAKKCFPNATICIDLFHVVNRVNKAMSDIRIRVQNDLLKKASDNIWLAGAQDDPAYKARLLHEKEKFLLDYKFLKNSQLLLTTKESLKAKKWATNMEHKVADLNRALSLSTDIQEMYDKLQEFHVILETDSYAMQRMFYTEWLTSCLSSDVPEIRAVATTLKHWRGYIQNTWENPQVSNGIAEGINNIIKVYKRISFGNPDFETMRKRLLLICGYTKQSKNPAAMFRQKLDDGDGNISF